MTACMGVTKEKTRDTSVVGITGEMKLKSALQRTLKELWDDVPLEVDTTETNLEKELQRIIDRYKVIDSLMQTHSSLRDTLIPLFWDLCPTYHSLKRKLQERDRNLHDSILFNYIESGPKTPENEFLSALWNQRMDTTLLAPERAMAPVYNFRKDSAGIYLDNLWPENLPELKLLMDSRNVPDSLKRSWDHGFVSFPQLLDSIFPSSQKLWLYSKSGNIQVKVAGFARFQDECNDYFYYHLDSENQSLTGREWTFVSPIRVDLVIGNYPERDRIISAQYPDICNDCPSSWSYQRTFARLREYENIYFTYAAEPEKELDAVDTPLRAVFYVRDTVVIPIWNAVIDRFGCSCL